MKLSIIIPAYNEDLTIKKTIDGDQGEQWGQETLSKSACKSNGCEENRDMNSLLTPIGIY